MKENLQEDEIVRLLQTIPGIGLILAHVIRAEIGEIERFPRRTHLRKYSGTAPLSDDSADRHGARHCSLACNHTLRWAFIEAATGVLSTKESKAPRLHHLYNRLTCGGRYNKNQAKVALAGELAELVHVVWSKKAPYSANPPARPGSIQRQPAKCRRPQQNNTRNIRPDQSRHPIARQCSNPAGQALS